MKNEPIYVIEVPYRGSPTSWLATDPAALLSCIKQKYPNALKEWEQEYLNKRTAAWQTWETSVYEVDDDLSSFYLSTFDFDDASWTMQRYLYNAVFAQTREELEDIAKNYNGHQFSKVRALAQNFLDGENHYIDKCSKDCNICELVKRKKQLEIDTVQAVQLQMREDIK